MKLQDRTRYMGRINDNLKSYYSPIIHHNLDYQFGNGQKAEFGPINEIPARNASLFQSATAMHPASPGYFRLSWLLRVAASHSCMLLGRSTAGGVPYPQPLSILQLSRILVTDHQTSSRVCYDSKQAAPGGHDHLYRHEFARGGIQGHQPWTGFPRIFRWTKTRCIGERSHAGRSQSVCAYGGAAHITWERLSEK